VEKIKLKFLSLLSYKPIIKDVADYDDMTGPIIVFILFGIFLMLVSDVDLQKGKVHFGYIYGFGLSGCLGIYAVINLLSQKSQYVELYKTFSVMGYSLMPFVLLAALSLFSDLK
jgi:hypothetical protein